MDVATGHDCENLRVAVKKVRDDGVGRNVQSGRPLVCAWHAGMESEGDVAHVGGAPHDSRVHVGHARGDVFDELGGSAVNEVVRGALDVAAELGVGIWDTKILAAKACQGGRAHTHTGAWKNREERT